MNLVGFRREASRNQLYYIFYSSLVQLLYVSKATSIHVSTPFSTFWKVKNMAKRKDTGVYQKKDGYWEYRFVIRIDGKKIGRKKCTDEHGNKFRTKKEAMTAREEAMRNLRIEKTEKPKMARKTVKEVFEEFRAEGRKDRAYKTKLKQDILIL